MLRYQDEGKVEFFEALPNTKYTETRWAPGAGGQRIKYKRIAVVI